MTTETRVTDEAESLPALPPMLKEYNDSDDGKDCVQLYTSDQMRAYARAALTAALPHLDKGGKGEPVAWAIRLPNGNIAKIGWMDMSMFDGAQKHMALVEGARYAFAYAAPQPAAQQPATPWPCRDWPEDAAHENGNYECICTDCGFRFAGLKRRTICKACAQPAGDGGVDAIKDSIYWKARSQRAEATLRSLGYTGIFAETPPMADPSSDLPELPKAKFWGRRTDGALEIQEGEKPPNRSGGYSTPWAALYDGPDVRAYTSAAIAALRANAGGVK